MKSTVKHYSGKLKGNVVMTKTRLAQDGIKSKFNDISNQFTLINRVEQPSWEKNYQYPQSSVPASGKFLYSIFAKSWGVVKNHR